ncbi:glycosyltransferase family 4 protein [Candidatus Woesearchaeota archaeon]|nr:glycosyltransferase family 4 protein [Candidatus Woesearchaeota archaeon]
MTENIVDLENVKKPVMVIASDNFLPRRDGITRFLSEVIPRLKDKFDIIVICPDYEGVEVLIDGVKFVRVPLSKRVVGDFKLPKVKFRRIIKAVKKADIVFTQTLGPIGGSALFFAQKLRRKTVAFIHNIEWELVAQATSFSFVKRYSYPITKRITHYLYSRCSYLVVPSESISDVLTWKDLRTPKKIINLGVDTNKFKPSDDSLERLKLRELLGVRDDQLVIGYHGRIAREKDLATLMRAFVKLRNQHPSLKLLVVGSGIKEIEKQLEKQPGVIHVPAVSDVEKYLQAMDIYCLTSLTETTSLSVLEAMSTSLPVVTSRVGFVKDYISHGINGLFFQKGDSFSLAKEIELLIESKQLREKLGGNARHTIVHRFDWDLTGMRLVDFFENTFIKTK